MVPAQPEQGRLPVDFVMEFYGKSFPEAVQLLTPAKQAQASRTLAPPTRLTSGSHCTMPPTQKQ